MWAGAWCSSFSYATVTEPTSMQLTVYEATPSVLPGTTDLMIEGQVETWLVPSSPRWVNVGLHCSFPSPVSCDVNVYPLKPVPATELSASARNSDRMAVTSVLFFGSVAKMTNE